MHSAHISLSLFSVIHQMHRIRSQSVARFYDARSKFALKFFSLFLAYVFKIETEEEEKRIVFHSLQQLCSLVGPVPKWIKWEKVKIYPKWFQLFENLPPPKSNIHVHTFDVNASEKKTRNWIQYLGIHAGWLRLFQLDWRLIWKSFQFHSICSFEWFRAKWSAKNRYNENINQRFPNGSMRVAHKKKWENIERETPYFTSILAA